MSRSNLLGTLLFLGFIVLSNSVYVISETQRGVLLKFGEVVKSDLEPGLHFKTPFVNSVRKFDGRILTVDSTPERFFTQEQKQLIVDSYAKFRVSTPLNITRQPAARSSALPLCYHSGSMMTCVTRWRVVPFRRSCRVNVTN